MGNVSVFYPTIGVKVIRGKDWEWGNQDHDEHGPSVGVIIDIASRKNWVRVKWEGRNINSYRVGDNGKFDLYYAEDPSFTPIKTAFGYRIRKEQNRFIFGCGEVEISKEEIAAYLTIKMILKDRGIAENDELNKTIGNLLRS